MHRRLPPPRNPAQYCNNVAPLQIVLVFAIEMMYLNAKQGPPKSTAVARAEGSPNSSKVSKSSKRAASPPPPRRR